MLSLLESIMDTRIRETIGRRIKELREEAGLSQADLAKEMNISQASVAQYEIGKNFPDEEKLIFFSKRFHVTLDFIFGLSDIKREYETKPRTAEVNLDDQNKEELIKAIMSGQLQVQFVTREMGQDAVYPSAEPRNNKK